MAKRRFIAGAKCPQCQEQDSVQLVIENNVERIECVACGYKQTQASRDAESAAKGDKEQIIGIFKPQ
ncbi:YheV family putative zinc ribbon protein [Gallaecimonas kandeliae]|uniref:YheV family putative zinc ribbon protein n=1 Tax=Gallaecimonas kandeliae TaxID=3029055 RepID=UPI0026472797|nr:YheV family putative zinc ribbon protein [Gallaecimonas kandeliae]WKE65189.1 YheV family putative zinc ribbon protein [Gallaecimonas kandeliae]